MSNYTIIVFYKLVYQIRVETYIVNHYRNLTVQQFILEIFDKYWWITYLFKSVYQECCVQCGRKVMMTVFVIAMYKA